jgi:tetratricopeptide (TPR) repeat protein
MIPRELLESLRTDLVERRISCGFNRLDASEPTWHTPDPAQPGSAALAGWLAQWVDIGYRDFSAVRVALSSFPPAARSHLPLTEYAHLRIADASVAMASENWDEAIRHLQFVISIEAELDDRILPAVAHYWTARTLRQKGEYQQALEHEAKGEATAAELGYARMTAVMQVLRSWLLFQRGRNRESWALLEQAEEVLRGTDDHGVLGNIHSAYGRMLRRQGRHEAAIRCFEKSIEEYRAMNPRHRNVARSLANMAYVKRVLALQWRRKIDADAAERRKTDAAEREKFAQYRSEALEHLHEAGEIYTELHQHHGAGTVRVNSGLLHLDGGDLELAADEAASAYEIGHAKEDHILMARARILQCMIENAKLEEQVEMASPQSALDFAREAVELGKQTDNARLLARAYLWQASTLAGEFYGNPDAARESLDAAIVLIRPDQNDPLWQDLQELRGRIVGGGTVDARLRAWSAGDVGNKSLQQITEEFAEVIIPKVWEKEDRKVARVAKRLKVSPKKVRRILATLEKRGALNGSGGGATRKESPSRA